MSIRTRYKTRVEWGDCDAGQHVYYPNYFRMFDSATHHMFEAAGFPLARVIKDYDVLGMPIVHAEGDFRASCEWGENLEVESHIAEWRGKSFVVSHTIWRGEMVVAEGHEIWVWAARHPDNPSRPVAGEMPPEIRAGLEAAAAAS